jgi:ferredoxin
MFDNIKVLHLEPTTVCNAACPQCAREYESKYDDRKHRSELTIDQIKETFNKEFILKLDKMFMCGVFGDPAASSNCIDIFKYFREINPKITLGLNTNGSIQNTKWWAELGNILSQERDYCVFSIDGLEDTNPLYRVNTRFDKIIENAKSFINAGGSAHWDMLIFQHNEHQVNQARNLAKNLGFSWFRTKVSKRFDTFPVKNLQPPTGHTPSYSSSNHIVCYARDIENSVYMSANGMVLPCCWFGSEVFSLDEFTKTLLSDWTLLENSWSSDPHPICKKTCSVLNNGNKFTDQWKSEEQLK